MRLAGRKDLLNTTGTKSDIIRQMFIPAITIIFWFDYRKIFNEASNRNKEALKRQILDVLNGGFWLRHGGYKINKVYELAENIYRGFSLDEIDNQFLMHPFGGFRFEGELSIGETCKL